MSTIATWTSASESSTTPDASRSDVAAMLSPSAPSESAFAASESRLVARPSAMAVSLESRPSIELAIPPTAFAAPPSGDVPRMLTDRSTLSRLWRLVRTPTIVSAAAATAVWVRSSVVLKVAAVVDASWSAWAVASSVVVSCATEVSTRSPAASIRVLA